MIKTIARTQVIETRYSNATLQERFDAFKAENDFPRNLFADANGLFALADRAVYKINHNAPSTFTLTIGEVCGLYFAAVVEEVDTKIRAAWADESLTYDQTVARVNGYKVAARNIEKYLTGTKSEGWL